MNPIGHDTVPHDEGRLWAIVLAGGEGSRLRSLTGDRQGASVPKQFCQFLGRGTLLEQTLARAARVAPPERTVIVLSLQHRRWWMPLLADLPRHEVVIQPSGRGTAAGILLPLIQILRQDEDARVVVLPSDQFVADENALGGALGRAADLVDRGPEALALLGLEADRPTTQYGWILPAHSDGADPDRVAGFFEKPDIAQAAKLLECGGLWNGFIFAARARALLEVYSAVLPEVLRPFVELLPLRSPEERWQRLEAIYGRLPARDFSRDLLQRCPEQLLVVRTPACGWTDLGTPERVTQCLAGMGYGPASACYWDPDEDDEWIPDIAARCLSAGLDNPARFETVAVA